MATETKLWTLEEVHSLPEDGNRYELVHGVLYVTPPPIDDHETIAARLTRILDPYVAKQRLGLIYHPPSVFRIAKQVQLEPDLMVRQPHPHPIKKDEDWETAPVPILVVEIPSPSTRVRDFGVKRDVYLDEGGISEYWIVNGAAEEVYVYRRGGQRMDVSGSLTWSPPGVSKPLVIDLRRVFS